MKACAKLSIENLKLEFKQYLIEQGIEPELDDNKELSGASIFTYENEFKNFVEEKYNIDTDEESDGKKNKLSFKDLTTGVKDTNSYEAKHQRVYCDIFENYNQTGLETWNGHILCVNYADINPSRLPEYLDEVIGHYSKQYKIDTNRISIAGYSLGGSRSMYMSSNKANDSSSGSYLNDDIGYKYRNATFITGYERNPGDYDIPVAVFNDEKTASSNSVLSTSTKPKLDLSETGADYWVNTGASHSAVDYDAFTRDDNKNGKADIFEFQEGTLKE